MKKELGELENIRDTFIGEFVRFGTKNEYKWPLPTLLLKDVRRKTDNKLMTDHLWFNLTKASDKASLIEGDLVQFDARVKEYEKGYKGYRDDVYCPIERDYKLSHPTKVMKVKKTEC